MSFRSVASGCGPSSPQLIVGERIRTTDSHRLGLHNAGSVSVAVRELRLASHIVAPSREYLPHGIYVSRSKLVYFGGSQTDFAANQRQKRL
jgi:hypothetical protein